MKILFVVSSYTKTQLRLQPWLTIHRIGLHFKRTGHQVHVITDCDSQEQEDFIIHPVATLRGINSSQILSAIESIQPDKIIVCVSPLSLVSASWYRIFEKYNAYAFMSNAFYTVVEVFKAFRFMTLKDCKEFGRQMIVPRFVWGRQLKKRFKGVICQSINTRDRLKEALNSKIPVHFIPPGIDFELWPLKKTKEFGQGCSVFLYAGSLKKIRGYELILKAFSQIKQKGITLQLLARGADDIEVQQIRDRLSGYGINCHLDIVGGWIPAEGFREYLQNATAVLLPFILVPSELPVTVMESIACGTPVIVSNIDGLPGAAGSAGYVVPHADVQALVRAVKKIHLEKSECQKLENACTSVRESMISWETVSQKWHKVLEN